MACSVDEKLPLKPTNAKPKAISRVSCRCLNFSLAAGLVAPKVLNVLCSASQSSMESFLSVFYEHTAGFSKVQIGWLSTIPSIFCLVAPPFWGAVADCLHNQRLVHIVCIVSISVLMLFMQYFRDFNGAMIMAVLANFQLAPCGSLLDHAILDLLAQVGGEYGRQRLFGSIGWGLGAYITGVMVGAWDISWAFNMSFVFSMAMVPVLRSIPPPVDQAVCHHNQDLEIATEELSNSSSVSFLDSMRTLVLRRPDVLVLLVVVFFMSLMFGIVSTFLPIYMYNLSGNNAQIIGVATLCETASELPAFFFSHRLIGRIGTVNVLLLGTAAYALRITFYATMTNAWNALAFSFLHGVTFALTWATTTEYLYDAAPSGTVGTVIGLLNTVQNSLGSAAGALVGGYLYDNYGAQSMWWVANVGVPVTMVALAVFAYTKRKCNPNAPHASQEQGRVMPDACVEITASAN
ncbi:TPA: hypothetical protein N0F65_009897 [Lagenidium giganteum]|uniref:Major facilitator superfamily (MFS) profile domain-containing protein n=1 Tax=Lagenidium giganteum TaxID=4803 RepID=A0AAV2YVV0_9STRA|nr:TPA: hypothetical protein N0F65_009897 [Lagenidium giganteum]